ncbi:NusG domain II-containing protein [Anaerolentibacter hominis]|uniref:NusG domain II-containing protein n=1 Tax=Anaerolentibacter hominis TaxID=3079009 RepID=UPI0031B85535
MNKKRRNDWILAGVILAAALFTGMIFLGKGWLGPGQEAVVYIDGTEKGRYSLKEDRREIIYSGTGENVLVIEAGEVYMESADCPDKLCVKQGKIKGDGQMLVCLPNKVIVQIEGE